MNPLETKKIHSIAEAVSAVINEEKQIGRDEIRFAIDWNTAFTEITSGLKKGFIFQDMLDMVSFEGPLAFIDVIKNVTEFETVGQKDKAIAQIEKNGLEYEGEVIEKSEQAYVPKSLKVKKEGDYTAYYFKLKPNFAKLPVLNKNIRIAEYGGGE